ncbi:hypothetical protein C1637_20820 [Chryseobacterium lactis]|uniref:Uncharacterized protein n=1 Tax=Chryseobacterium lactis TaxID=1241981 RepID=A0A3G6RNF7_CHRLC|nr:hypothetical protein [Chryseobacterium lactis]AZA82619.1 hypothetical protein EG342_12335 [Chryseobacterium lactis]AZB03000.1 hypothetical protein EG341_03195 [Chryseobacterium lactis]PNW11859.1 hypothetical protein C1637_20820 [Chryseobacterium lactis]
MNYFVYGLEHIYRDETHTAFKFLGYFDDMEMLEKSKIIALELPGFSTYPDGMVTRKYELNKIHWRNGFDGVVGEIGRDYLHKEDIITEKSKSIKELNLEYIFQVSHACTIDTYLDDERTLGVFLNEYKANDVVNNCKKMMGFKDYPDDFIIGRFTLNNLLWTSGF